MTQAGRVYLVGAGPGDPGLITLRGAELLARADAVLYDYLVNPELLQHVGQAAERICLGQHGRTRIWSQEEVHAELIRRARLGQTIVRLKSGDPAVFGRLTEELEALQAAAIEYEVVPGITAALAAASYAGVPITHRDLASAVALVTGQEHAEKPDSAIDFEALARFPGTLVFYMGVTTAPQWTAALIAAGKPAATPAAILRRCSFPDQRVLHCALGEVAETIRQSRVRPPVIVVVGEVAKLGPALSWFEKRPLFGQTILVTRPAHQARELAAPLRELGADVLAQPAIEIGAASDTKPIDDAIARVRKFDWLVFASANGVRYFLQRLLQEADLRLLGDVKLAAIGPGTADALREFHLAADLIPDEFRAESLAQAFGKRAQGQRFLLLRASRGREVLSEQLQAAGGLVEQVVVYESQDATAPLPEIAERLQAGQIDWITVTSSAIARSLVNLFGAELNRAKLVSISPITSATLRELGYSPAAEAGEYTMAGVVQAILAGLPAA
jgi:uroporphyrinogen III methyltransferase/synthase